MGDGRIKVAKDKAELVEFLKTGSGLFQTYADVLVFAASLGIHSQSRKPILEIAKIDPIRLSVFGEEGYKIINLIAVVDSNNPKILAKNAEEERIKIFEEYANSGLEILANRLKQFANEVSSVLSLLSEFIEEETKEIDEFDLSRFINS